MIMNQPSAAASVRRYSNRPSSWEQVLNGYVQRIQACDKGFEALSSRKLVLGFLETVSKRWM